MSAREASHVVSRAEVRHFALATAATDPVHHDVELARSRGYRDLVAPPSFFSVISLSRGRELPSSQLRVDGLAAAEELTGRVVAGGAEIRWHSVLCAGDVVGIEEHHLAPREVVGRTGPLVIHTAERAYSLDDRPAVEERAHRIGVQDHIAPVGPSLEAPPAGAELVTSEVRPSEVDLFMFCAATWLTHRIHYDREYARSEGYADLVVPGPLQMAYLANLVDSFARHHGGRLVELGVRHRAPAMCGHPLTLSAWLATAQRRADGVDLELTLRAAAAGGAVHTTGRAAVSLPESAALATLLSEHRAA